jgi:hypothetical protein
MSLWHSMLMFSDGFLLFSDGFPLNSNRFASQISDLKCNVDRMAIQHRSDFFDALAHNAKALKTKTLYPATLLIRFGPLLPSQDSTLQRQSLRLGLPALKQVLRQGPGLSKLSDTQLRHARPGSRRSTTARFERVVVERREPVRQRTSLPSSTPSPLPACQAGAYSKAYPRLQAKSAFSNVHPHCPRVHILLWPSGTAQLRVGGRVRIRNVPCS